MSTVKVYVTNTTVEPLSSTNHNAGRSRTPRVLNAGEFYDVEQDVADKLFATHRADPVGEKGVPKDKKDAAKQEQKANTKIPTEQTAPLPTSGGQPLVNTLGKSVASEEGAKDQGKSAPAKTEKTEVVDKYKDWSLDDLKDHAKKHKIDIKGARTIDAIIAKIEAAE